MLRSTRQRTFRRGYGIRGYVGPNGSGKSAALVFDCLPSLDAGRPVLSTVRLLDWRDPRPCAGCHMAGYHPTACPAGHPLVPLDGEPGTFLCLGTECAELVIAPVHAAAHPGWVPWDAAHGGWRQLLDVEHADVIADEVTGVASSRESQSLPAPIANTLVQLRRRDVVLSWSAPSWTRAEKIMRETTQLAVLCEGFLPVTVRGEDGEDKQWRQRRLFKWHGYDAQLLDDFNAQLTGQAQPVRSRRRDRLRPVSKQLFWGPGSDVFLSYDTYDAVTSIGAVSDSGRCLDCGGRRAPVKCYCSADHDDDPARTVAAGPRRGAATGAPGGGMSPAGDSPAGADLAYTLADALTRSAPDLPAAEGTYPPVRP